MDYRITLARPDLLLSLKRFRLPRRKAHEKEQAIIGFDGQYLTIQVANQTVLAHAEGEWPGNAYVHISLVRALIQAPPSGDSILVRCDGEQLCFGSLRVACRWQPISRDLLLGAPPSNWLYGIALTYTRTRGDLLASGLTSEVNEAERKLANLIDQAAKLLAPVGVTLDDVRSIVERRLQERYVGSTDPPTFRPAAPPPD